MSNEKKDSKKIIKSPSIKLTDEQEKRLDYFLSAPLRSANSLMKKLYSDDDFYKNTAYAWVGEKDAKKLFLYGVCKEVLKVCIGLMNNKETLQERPPGELDPLEKIIAGSIFDLQTYHIRKMVELLSLLILFDRNTKNDEEYRIFLSAENMNLSISRQEDFRDLYEKRIISNTQHSIDDYAERIQQDMQKIGISEIWFLDNKKLKKQKPGIFKTKKALYLSALLIANADESLALGISYGRGYSRTSQSLHPMIGSHDYDKNFNKLIANFSYISILCMHIMHLAYKIAGIEDPHGLAKVIGENFEKSEASKTIAGLKKEFELGDLVLTAWNDLVEIIDMHTSKYSYRAYKIKYLSNPPLPEFPEDWIEAQSITARLMTKSWVRSFYEKHTHYEELPKEVAETMKEVMKGSDDEILKYAKSFFLDMHKHKILIPMLLESGFLKRKDTSEF